jgi:hypothetical protein
MTLRQLSAKPGEDPQAPSSVYATHSNDDERAPRKGLHTGPYSVCRGSGLRATTHLRSGTPRAIC